MHLIREAFNAMRTRDCQRFQTQINKDMPLIPLNHNIQSVPKWDDGRNNPLSIKKRMRDMFLKVANLIIMRSRATGRLKKLKDAFKKNNINNRKDCKAWVAENWKQAQLANIMGGIDDKDNEDNIANVRYTFQFHQTELGIKSDLIWPIEYETNINSVLQEVDAAPIQGFDDLEWQAEIEQLDAEYHQYKPMAIPVNSNYDPNE